MTVHQPSTDIYQKFDRLFLLVEGQLAFQGEASLAADYFKFNFGLDCLEIENDASFLIDRTHPQKNSNRNRYDEYFSTYEKKIVPSVEDEISAVPKGAPKKRKSNKSSFTTLKILLERDLINIWRNPRLFKSRFLQSIFLGLFLGGIYFKAGSAEYSSPSGWHAIVGLMFFLTISVFMSGLAPVSVIFPQ